MAHLKNHGHPRGGMKRSVAMERPKAGIGCLQAQDRIAPRPPPIADRGGRGEVLQQCRFLVLSHDGGQAIAIRLVERSQVYFGDHLASPAIQSTNESYETLLNIILCPFRGYLIPFVFVQNNWV